MAKQQGRKPPRRKQPITQEIDPDLIELARVLDEHKSEQNARGWFSLPWRDGRNAIGLARVTTEDLIVRSEIAYIEDVRTWIHSVSLTHQDAYERADLLIADTRSWKDDSIVTCLRVLARCTQLYISNSSGGGELYNNELRKLTDTCDPESVLRWRCVDAIEAGPQLQGDALDRARGAFKIAWERGLFHAAYSIRPGVHIR